MKELIDIAIRAAVLAGDAIMEVYESDDFGVDIKADDSPLTKADLASNNVITAALLDTGIPLLSEEGIEIPYEDRKAWTRLWIVDPLDGTKEFIKRNGEFTVNIALVDKQVPVMGVIYVPVTKVLYFGADSNAFKVEGVSADSLPLNLDNALKMPIASVKDRVGAYRVVASRSHMSPETEAFIAEKKVEHGDVELVSKGSSLKLCMVAEGVADCYPRFAPTMEWDTAAGHAIARAAGFSVVDWVSGKEMIYNREILRNNWFLVS